MQRAGLLAEEPGQVAGDRRVGGVGQADLGQADAAAARGLVGRRAAGEEAVEQDAVRAVSRVSSVLIEPPMTFEPRPRTATGAAAFLGSAKSVSLAVRQAWPSATRWAASSPSMPLGQRRGDGVGQGEVHVVAAEQDVLADGQPGQGEVAPLVGHGDQGEVGRAAADVADQEDVADLDLLPPLVALRGEPGVEGGLRLLEQRDLLRARPPRGLDGQLAGDGVERGGDGQEDVLVLEPVGGRLAGDPVVPGVAQVGEVGRRGRDRRDLRDVLGGRPGQDRPRGGRRRGARASSWPS